MSSQQNKEFVHLHVHSEYSLLDGLSRISHLAKRAQTLNQPAIALTDHGAMYGTIEFYNACKKAGVKPIIGLESYVAARGMADRDSQLDKKRFHLLLLAHNQAGYLNLLKVASESQLNGFYYKPRVDHDFMARHSEGLIATSGCLAGEIPRAIDEGRTKDAHKLMGFYLDTYGKDNFFLELQEHDIPQLTRVNQQLIEMAPRYGLENNFIVTNDVHYTTAEEGDPHEVLLCIQTGSTTKNPKLTLSNKEYYLKSYDEMMRLFSGYPDSAIRNAFHNSLLIAERCDVDLDPKGYHLPLFDVPEGFTPHTYLRHLCEKGLEWRYGADRATNDEVLQHRLEHELGLIHRMGFDTYFLIVWDLCEFARRSPQWWEQHGATFYPDQTYKTWKRNDIWWNVRGSGAGSVVAYSLGITGIDPIANGLIFERFLNPGRVSMPDIDLDYPDNRRHEMVGYTMQRYGAEKVAQIITFGTMKARAAIRDVGRAMDITLDEVDKIAKMVPAIPGKKVTIANLFDEEHEFYNKEFISLYNSDAQARDLIDTAQQLEGVSRHASSHAAGVIIADKPLVEYVPLNRPTSGDAGLGGVDRVTQWPMEIVEAMGLLKVDFLGLSTLTVLRTAARIIEERHGTKYEMDTIPYDIGHVGPDPSKDPQALFDMLSRGDVAGVFQVEGAGMKRLMKDMKPQRFDHIIAAISLYRPGPMENIPEYIKRMHSDIFDNNDIVTYHTPLLEPILKDTYGIIVYQEQIIRIASDLAGYAPGDADMIRKAVAKKKKKLMDEHRVKFTDGAMERGLTREVCDQIWGDIEFFARYGFNKAHAADYAVITCQTAYLKAHYPVEYMTALLSVEREKTEKVTRYLAETRRMGIDVAPPDINMARVRFNIEDQPDGSAIIRYGLGAIKNAGEGALRLILAERDTNGQFNDVQDLCERVDLRRVGSRALEAMIKVGVFDQWGTRPQFLDGLKRIISYSNKHIEEKSSAQMSLFGLLGTTVEVAKPDLLRPENRVKEVDHRQLLDWERELIGVYLSEHPLERQLKHLEPYVSHAAADVDVTLNGKQVALGGMFASIRPYNTKKGDAMAFGVLEDLSGKIDLVLFPRTWASVREDVKQDQIAVVRGKVNVREDSVSIIVETVKTTVESVAAMPDEIDPQPRLNDFAVSQEPPVVEPIAPQVEDEQDLSPLSWEIEDEEDENEVVVVAARREHDKSAEPTAPPPPIVNEPPIPYQSNGHHETDDVPPEPEFDDDWGFATIKQATVNRQQLTTNNLSTPENNTNGQILATTNGQPPIPKNIIIEIKPVGDWRETLRQSVRLIGEYDGSDSFVLQLSESGLLIDFPEQTTQFCSDLARSLEKLQGVRRVYSRS